MMRRMKKVLMVLAGLIAVSIMSYGTATGSVGLDFSAVPEHLSGNRAQVSDFGMVQSIEIIGPVRQDAAGATAAGVMVQPVNINSPVECSDLVYRVTLQLDDGSAQSYMQRMAPDLHPGDRVLVATDAME